MIKKILGFDIPEEEFNDEINNEIEFAISALNEIFFKIEKYPSDYKINSYSDKDPVFQRILKVGGVAELLKLANFKISKKIEIPRDKLVMGEILIIRALLYLQLTEDDKTKYDYPENLKLEKFEKEAKDLEVKIEKKSIKERDGLKEDMSLKSKTETIIEKKKKEMKKDVETIEKEEVKELKEVMKEEDLKEEKYVSKEGSITEPIRLDDEVHTEKVGSTEEIIEEVKEVKVEKSEIIEKKDSGEGVFSEDDFKILLILKNNLSSFDLEKWKTDNTFINNIFEDIKSIQNKLKDIEAPNTTESPKITHVFIEDDPTKRLYTKKEENLVNEMKKFFVKLTQDIEEDKCIEIIKSLCGIIKKDVSFLDQSISKILGKKGINFFRLQEEKVEFINLLTFRKRIT